MYCRECGKEIENNSKFCKFCGTAVEGGKRFVKPNIKIDIKGNFLWTAASFLVIIWQGMKPWIKIDIPFIAATEIQWYNIFKIFKKIQEFAGRIAYGSDELKISGYAFIGMIPFLLWAIAGLSILYVGYLLYTKERKVKILEAAGWAMQLSMAASALSVVVLLSIGVFLSSEMEGMIDLDFIKPTTANYIVLIVSFLAWKVVIPRYRGELEGTY
ncbi:MAG: zinc ribbon domain-containing protein [Hungatella sp.]|nr:zinc ribbon domain-containing protein [Hungatella sp.]